MENFSMSEVHDEIIAYARAVRASSAPYGAGPTEEDLGHWADYVAQLEAQLAAHPEPTELERRLRAIAGGYLKGPLKTVLLQAADALAAQAAP